MGSVYKGAGLMADFDIAFDRTMKAEGGYQLTNIPGDRGGQTYSGIARNAHPDWQGWKAIDIGQTPLTSLVRDFYRDNFWHAVRGDLIAEQDVANSIYDFAVNAGTKTAIKLAQVVVGAQADGALGPKTLAALNEINPVGFKPAYALAKIARYRDIIKRDPSQKKFITGWLTRALESAA